MDTDAPESKESGAPASVPTTAPAVPAASGQPPAGIPPSIGAAAQPPARPALPLQPTRMHVPSVPPAARPPAPAGALGIGRPPLYSRMPFTPTASSYTPAPVGRPPSRPPGQKPKAPRVDRARNVALANLAGGNIGLPSQDTPAPGFQTAGGGARKVLPELVLPYALPAVPPDAQTEGEPLEKRYVAAHESYIPAVTQAVVHDAHAPNAHAFQPPPAHEHRVL